MAERIRIPPGHGKAARLEAGERLRLVNTRGAQVVDAWAFNACDRYRYRLLGCEGYHRNCQDNMVEGLMEVGVTPPFQVSGSWNVFMNIPVGGDRNSLEFRPAVSRPGDYVVLRAEMDCFVVFSSCPRDVLPINGEGGQPPREAHFEVLPGGPGLEAESETGTGTSPACP